MNGPVDEIRRLRGELADKDRELAELRGLVQQHLEATAGDEQRALDRERAAYEHGKEAGDEFGYRRGIEHALCAVEEAHLNGNAHDQHGQMKGLGLHNGPVPEPLSADERVAKAEAYAQIRAAWWEREFERTRAENNVREIRLDIDLEAG